MPYEPSNEIQDHLSFGEFGGVNPSITDSSTYTFLSPEKMEELFDHEIEGCFLYSRHWNPTNKYLSGILSKLEGSESALVTGSGMAAIATTILQLCNKDDEIVSSHTIYGGTYALFKNFLPKFGIKVHFIDIKDIDHIKNVMSERTKVIYCESVSNPLLEVADIPKLRLLASQYDAKLVVDNTFSPLILSPLKLGADIVVHSMTKFINGTSDCVAGCVCSNKIFIDQLMDINCGAAMLLGPVLDSFRAASVMKNVHSLHIRIQKHSQNAAFLAEQFEKMGLTVYYPGLPSHPQHELIKELMNPGYGFGGILTIDTGSTDNASKLMSRMQEEKVGYLAVSLGFYKTLFSSPAHSTSSEIPKEEQDEIGLGEGLVRLSVGLDHDIQRTLDRISACLKEIDLI